MKKTALKFKSSKTSLKSQNEKTALKLKSSKTHPKSRNCKNVLVSTFPILLVLWHHRVSVLMKCNVRYIGLHSLCCHFFYFTALWLLNKISTFRLTFEMYTKELIILHSVLKLFPSNQTKRQWEMCKSTYAYSRSYLYPICIKTDTLFLANFCRFSKPSLS